MKKVTTKTDEKREWETEPRKGLSSLDTMKKKKKGGPVILSTHGRKMGDLLKEKHRKNGRPKEGKRESTEKMET